MTPVVNTDQRPVVLVIRLSALGDVALSAGVVERAAQRHPEVRFVMVTRKQFAPFFPSVEVYAPDLKGRHKGVAGIIRLAGDLQRAYSPVAVADLHDVIRTRLLRMLLHHKGASDVAVIDKCRAMRRRLVKGISKEPLPHVTLRYAAVFTALGFDPGPDASLPLPSPQRREPLEPVIGIAPFAAHPAKTYPFNMMTKMVEQLREARPDVRIFWFSAPGAEADKIASIAHDDDTIVARLNLPGGLGDEIELMRKMAFMLTMDSGNMHMAALAGTPAVSVWGPTRPSAGFQGLTSPDDCNITAPIICSPCSIYGNKYCRKVSTKGFIPCLVAIPPPMIVRHILPMLPPPR